LNKAIEVVQLNLRFLKTAAIKFLPGKIIRVLRYQKIVAEYLFYVLYSLGINKRRFYPYYLKRSASFATGVTFKESDDVCDAWGQAFCIYNSQAGRRKVNLIWADGPIPGNYGDWLSPYIITKMCNVNVLHLNEVGNYKQRHVVALGSIVGVANKHSVVVGAGVSSIEEGLDISSNFFSVRGPYTDSVILSLGGQKCLSYGDIGFLLARVYTPKVINKKSSILVVRHIQHKGINLNLDSDFREISINCTRPIDIENFIDELHTASFVATSAMHCFITCISYGIPCVLFSIADWKVKVPGDGIKYRDTLAGVALPEISPLEIVDLSDFCQVIKHAPQYKEVVDERVLIEIESCLQKAIRSCEY
jgi:hypothetical protein